MLFLYYYYYAFLLLALKLISKNLSIWWALLSILVTFWGERHLSGNNGALGWSILPINYFVILCDLMVFDLIWFKPGQLSFQDFMHWF